MWLLDGRIWFGRLKSRAKLPLALLVLGCLLWVGMRRSPPTDPYVFRAPGVRVLDQRGRLLRGFLSPDQKRRWRLDLAEISPKLITAVLQHEDRWFYRHPGVNPLAVARATWGNMRAGHIVSGASTLTMQLARLAEPRPRTLVAKLQQAWLALRYENCFQKNEILARYLNLAPYGGNLEGVGAASQVLLGKPARELSWAEACLLAVLPQAPLGHDPLRQPAAARRARDQLARQLFLSQRIDQEILAEVLSSPLPDHHFALPFQAPHFCRWVKHRHPGRVTLRTTLDRGLQRKAQQIVTESVRRLRPLGISQAAAVILDSRDGQIRALVGSAGFLEPSQQGQVNGAVALRSPGSTLKPLVYGLAFDRGLATPNTLVEDVPRWFADYHPKNYDGRFRGVVKAGYALQQSLNVPAVALAAQLERTPGGGLYDFLQQAGVTSLNQPREHYGLSLVLGGGEITLLELASCYGVLARQGIWLPTRELVPAPKTRRPTGRRLLGPGAVWLTLQEMMGVHRPEPEILWRNTTDRQSIPWKTGTSYGHRDAWSVGLAGPWVVAVWVGNFQGQGAPHLTGSTVAAPLFFSLIDGLNLAGPASWQKRPPRVKTRQVCSVSGLPANGACGALAEDYFLPGISPAGKCAVHRLVQVDPETGFSVCSRCRAGRRVESRSVEWWPPLVASYLAQGGLSRPVVPPHNPDCPAQGDREKPVITSPQADSEYYLRRGVPLADQALSLTSSTSAGCRLVWWFVDGQLVQKAGPGETVFFEPVAGRHRFTVVDDAGRSESLELMIHGQ